LQGELDMVNQRMEEASGQLSAQIHLNSTRKLEVRLVVVAVQMVCVAGCAAAHGARVAQYKPRDAHCGPVQSAMDDAEELARLVGAGAIAGERGRPRAHLPRLTAEARCR
jgi:hypothetical protein